MNFEKDPYSQANVADVKQNNLTDEKLIEKEPETEEGVQNQVNPQIQLIPLPVPTQAISSLNAKMGLYDDDEWKRTYLDLNYFIQ